MRALELTGKQFGRLVVVRRQGSLPPHATWLCRCVCGKEVVTRCNALMSGKTNSCGCLQREMVKKRCRIPRPAAARLLANYKCMAKKRGNPWLLTDEQFMTLTSSPCHYTGYPPQQIMKSSKGQDVYLYNGLDRLDNDGPYSMANCVPCLGEVNKMKRMMGREQFISMCRLIVERNDEKFLLRLAEVREAAPLTQ